MRLRILFSAQVLFPATSLHIRVGNFNICDTNIETRAQEMYLSHPKKSKLASFCVYLREISPFELFLFLFIIKIKI